MKNVINNKWFRIIAFTAIGALGGFAYYYFIGCAGGACPISSNPFISTGYGAFIGVVLGTPSRKKELD